MTTPRYAVSLLTLAVSVGMTNAYAERTTNYTYHATGSNGAGQVATMNGPRTDVSDISSYAYDASGNLSTMTNPLGHITQYSDYNGRGLAGKVTDANGVETLLTYHVRGWLTTTKVKDPGGNSSLDATTTFTYDAVGQITRITLPDSSYLDFEYDAAQRLVAIQNNLNERIEYTLDVAGNRTQEDIKNSGGAIVKTQTRAFDELSRLMRDVGASSQTTQISYDKNDNATQITDARSNPTDQAYDALNRLITQTDPDSGTINYTYDDQDRIKTVTDPRGLVTTYTYNGHGDLLSIASPDTGTTSYVYDAAGNRIQQTDARGVVVNYSYDALNRLTTLVYPASTAENVTYTYDDIANGNRGIGRLTKVDDESGDISFKYDHRNNLIEKTTVIETTNYTLRYSYDLANNLTQVIYPSGRMVNYSRDVAGRINAVTTQANGAAPVENVITGVSYSPFGPMATYTYGNGMTHSVAYDQDYRITDIEAQGSAAVLDLNYGYDPNSNITTLNDQKDNTQDQTFVYDKLNRLIDADGGYGDLDYQYDAVGNRTQKSTTVGTDSTTETYSYSSTSNRLDQVASDDGTTTTQRSLQYDANGNLITDTKPDGTVHGLTYNNANRYSVLNKNSTPKATYVYNALGKRVGKVSNDPTQDEHYHYNSAGLLLAVTKPTTGAAIREYIYLGTMKVAMLADSAGAASAPVAIDDTATTAEETLLALTVASLLSNDTDADGDTLTLTAVSSAVGGTVALNGQTISFTPANNFTGAASFDYTVSDGALTDTGRVNITVTGVNDAPVATNDNTTTAEDTGTVITLASLLSNDTDVDGDTLSITAVSSPTNGTASLDTVAGNVTFTPTANYNGAASFDYTLSDGAVSDTGTVNITITAVNDVPIAMNDAATIDEDMATVMTVVSLLSNDTDVDGNALSITAVANASNGTAVLNTAAGTVTFTPTGNYNGAASFTYTLSDGAISNTGTVNITVTAVNDMPVANDDNAATVQDTAIAINVSTLLANDTDTEGDTLSITTVSNAVNGAVSIDTSTAVITFTPTAGFSGTGSFVYTLSDGTLTSQATVNISISEQQNTLSTGADIGAVGAAGSHEYDAATGRYTVRGSGADIWGNDDTFYYLYQPINGDFDVRTRVLSSTGTSQWSKSGLMLRDSLTISSKHASIYISGSNGAAFQRRLADGGSSTHSGKPSYDDGSWIRLSRVGTTVTSYVSSDGVNWVLVGSDTLLASGDDYIGFAVTATTDDPATASSALNEVVFDTLNFGNANNSPLVKDDFLGASVNSPLTISTASILSNDSDVEGSTLFVSALGNVMNGTAVFNVVAETITFTPTTDFIGLATIKYTVSDGVLDSQGTVYINIGPIGGGTVFATAQDIGAVGAAGSHEHDAATGRYTVRGSGADIWGNDDTFYYLYQPINGDFDVKARMVSSTGTSQWSKSGLMLRDSLTVNSKHASIYITGSNGAAFQRRLADGGSSSHTGQPSYDDGSWIRLTRVGTLISSYVSSDGVNWVLVGSDTLLASGDDYIGFAVTATTDDLATTSSALNEAVFDNATLAD